MTNYTGDNAGNVFNGTSGYDVAQGAGGDDTLSGAGVNDVLAGDAGADRLDGGDGNDTLYAGSISPDWQAGNGSDFPEIAPLLDTGREHDVLTGGTGDDHIFAGFGDDVDGGEDQSGDFDRDSLVISLMGATSGVTEDFSQLYENGAITVGGGTIRNIEWVDWIEGSNFNDTIIPGVSQFGSVLHGRGGDDRLTSTIDTEAVHGDDGNDTIDASAGFVGRNYGDAGNDVISDVTQSASAYGGDGNDTLSGSGRLVGEAGDDVITFSGYSSYQPIAIGGSGNDTILAAGSAFGGSGADVVTGLGGNDRLHSGGADAPEYGTYDPDESYPDTLDFGTEHDVVKGGAGNDLLSVGYGDDADGGTGTNRLILVLGGANSGVSLTTAELVTNDGITLGGGTISHIQAVQSLWGSAFADTLTASVQAGTPANLHGGAGNDRLTNADNGHEGYLFGDEGDDILIGAKQADHLHGGAGADTIRAGGGDDVIYVDATSDIATGDLFDGGAGADTLEVAALFDVDLTGARFTNIETLHAFFGARLTSTQLMSFKSLQGGTFNLTDGGAVSLAGIDLGGGGSFGLAETAGSVFDTRGASGGSQIDVFGKAGDDTITGGTMAGLFYGGGGDDLFYAGTFSTTMNGADGFDTASFVNAKAAVTVSLLFTDYQETGGAGYATLFSIEKLIGSRFADRLGGSNAGDVLDGGIGADTLTGLKGDDRYIVDNAGDLVREGPGDGIDTVEASIDYTLTAYVENLVLAGSARRGSGNDLDNILTGGAGNDALSGLAGNDTLIGGRGDDVLSGGAGVDTANYADAASGVTVKLALAAGQNTLGAGTDKLIGIENLLGSAFNDNLAGDAGANRLDGGAGNDALTGGLGDDTLVGGAGIDTASYIDATAAVTVNLAITTAQNTGGAGIDTLSGIEALRGSAFADVLRVDALANRIAGAEGDDQLFGFAGADTLSGGTGRDRLAGGDGADRFAYATLADSTVAMAGRDWIRDFSHAQGDRIDLSAIDAVKGGTDNAFTFIGTAGFSHVAGQLGIVAAGADWIVQGDVDGDGAADFAIQVTSASALVAADFLL